MKTKIYLLALTVSVLLLPACDNYLKEDSGDLMIPKSVNEFQALLYGEAYPDNYDAPSEAAWINLLTDDVEMGHLTGSTSTGYDRLTMGEGQFSFTWQADIDSEITDGYWTARYNNILACNLTIDALPTMLHSDNETGKYHYVAAQAYALRAYNYLCLVNTYALPYSAANLDKPGVVLRLDPAVTESTLKMPRATIGEVYDQIRKDLKAAGQHIALSEPSSNKHLLSPAAIHLLASRAALYMEDWDAVIEAATDFFRENSYVFDLNDIAIDQMGGLEGSQIEFAFNMFNIDNKEIVFTFGRNNDNYAYLSSGGGLARYGFRTSWRKNSSLIQAYKQQFDPVDPDDENGEPKWVYDDTDDTNYFVEVDDEADADVYDLRLRAYFERKRVVGRNTYYSMYYPIKYRRTGGFAMQTMHECWRTVEVYLNAAEAYARKAGGIDATALELINKLRANRLRTDKYEELTAAHFASKDDFVRFIWQERRRELCFEENHRYWDLRRQGMPRLYHKWIDLNDVETIYMLPEGGDNYVMAIPRSEWTSNDLAAPNPRDIINPM